MGRSARSRGRARRERKTAEPYRHFDDRHPTKGNGGSARTGKGESRGGEHAQIFFPRQHQPRNTHSPQRHCRLFLAAGVGGRGISEEKQEYINIIENNNTLLLQLISDVLDLSKIEAGTMEFDYAPIDVHGLFIELEDTFRLRNKKSGICICYHRRTTECVVKADRNRLVQVMMNLMNNAVKFTGKAALSSGLMCAKTVSCISMSPTPVAGYRRNGWKKSSGILSNSTALCRARDSDSPFAGQSSKGWEERSVLSHGWVRGVLFGSRCLIRPTKRRFEKDVA